jgi:hypothetical protein
VNIDLSGAAPKFILKGSVSGAAYREGLLQLTGSAIAEGSGAAVLESARGEVSIISVNGASSTPVPEEDFRIGNIALQLQPAGVEPRWKFSISPQ